ncbi:MAG: V-type ATP synthase subunit D [Fervidicoccaceae archaeon]
MDPRRLLPTKINLIRLRREERGIKRIRKVLEEKRSALVLYVRTMIEEYERLYREVYESLTRAYDVYGSALIRTGYERARELAAAVPPTLSVVVQERMAFAVRVPVLRLAEEAPESLSEVLDVPPALVEAVASLREALASYVKLVEREYALRRLIEELKKTQRLINAIDNVVMPSIQKAIKHIGLVLSERSREEFIRLKLMKRKRSA